MVDSESYNYHQYAKLGTIDLQTTAGGLMHSYSKTIPTTVLCITYSYRIYKLNCS